jgi:hypothetical protein
LNGGACYNVAWEWNESGSGIESSVSDESDSLHSMTFECECVFGFFGSRCQARITTTKLTTISSTVSSATSATRSIAVFSSTVDTGNTTTSTTEGTASSTEIDTNTAAVVAATTVSGVPSTVTATPSSSGRGGFVATTGYPPILLAGLGIKDNKRQSTNLILGMVGLIVVLLNAVAVAIVFSRRRKMTVALPIATEEGQTWPHSNVVSQEIQTIQTQVCADIGEKELECEMFDAALFDFGANPNHKNSAVSSHDQDSDNYLIVSLFALQGEPYGFILCHHPSEKTGFVVQRIEPGSSAAASNQIHVGDYVTHINENDVRLCDDIQEIGTLIKYATPKLDLTLIPCDKHFVQRKGERGYLQQLLVLNRSDDQNPNPFGNGQVTVFMNDENNDSFGSERDDFADVVRELSGGEEHVGSWATEISTDSFAVPAQVSPFLTRNAVEKEDFSEDGEYLTLHPDADENDNASSRDDDFEIVVRHLPTCIGPEYSSGSRIKSKRGCKQYLMTEPDQGDECGTNDIYLELDGIQKYDGALGPYDWTDFLRFYSTKEEAYTAWNQGTDSDRHTGNNADAASAHFDNALDVSDLVAVSSERNSQFDSEAGVKRQSQSVKSGAAVVSPEATDENDIVMAF